MTNAFKHVIHVNLTSPKQLAEQLAAALPQQLKCVVLYGSAAAGDFIEGASNYNVLAVAEPLGIDQLNELSLPIVAWNRAGHATPLFFTPQQLTDSMNAFPIELLDIQQSRRILWGVDLLADLRVEHANLRRQVQRELNGKLLRLRSRYLLSAGHPKAVSELALRSLSTFLVLFRATLRLHQDTVPDTKLDALRDLAKHISFDPGPFEKLFEFKQHTNKRSGKLPDVSFASYLAAIECVAEAVNRQPKHKTGVNHEQ
jgi:hypothetical protein